MKTYTRILKLDFVASDGSGKWFVTLEYIDKGELSNWIPSLRGLMLTNTIRFEITTVPDNLKIPDVAKKSYKDINNPNSPPGKFQIEADGSLIAVETNSWRVLTGLSGIRYATQADFDKMCFDNPDPRYPYDWNAEVYKLFIEHQESLPVPSNGCDNLM